MSLDTKQNYCEEWNQLHQNNFKFYQDQIDRITYGLQRAQRGNLFTGSLLYPLNYQKNILDLELLLRKQQLGEIKQSEVDIYKQINSRIAKDLNMSFNRHVPTNGLMIGAINFGVLHKFNVSYAFRMSGILIPVIGDYMWTQYSSNKKGVKFNCIEFMDWAIQNRKAQAQLQINKGKIQSKLLEEYSRHLGNINLVKAIEQLPSL